MVRHPSSAVILASLAAALSGCAGNAPQLPSLSMPTASTGPSAEVSSSPSVSPSGGSDAPPGIPLPGAVGSATDIYSRVATGAMACWFSVRGPLKKDYIFHAAADPASRGGGGKAVVTIHERDRTAANPRGPKAYIIEILPTGEASAHVTVENRRMPEAFSAAMTDDISRWSKGEDGCAGPSTAAKWPPMPSETVAETPKTAKKVKKPKTKVNAQAKPAAQAATEP